MSEVSVQKISVIQPPPLYAHCFLLRPGLWLTSWRTCLCNLRITSLSMKNDKMFALPCAKIHVIMIHANMEIYSRDIVL